MSVNNVVYQGNITKDLDLRYAQSGTAILSFTIGVSRDFVDKQSGQRESDFINCKAFGKTAELIAQHFQKGAEILVTGRTQTGSFENQQGQKIYTNDCMVNSFNFTRGSKQGDSPQPHERRTTNQQPKQGNIAGMDPFGNNSQIDINDNDLPF